jgi:colanic acid/amylovoran biosynthesis protein
MNILIINAHSSRNKGDAGIVLSMIDAIKKHSPGANIKIHSRFPDIDGKFYEDPVASCVENVSVDPKSSKIKKVLSSLNLLSILNNTKSVKSDDYAWADVVVSCGGGFLLSHRFSVALLQHLVQIKTAFDYNKPVVIYSQSIGPFYNNYMQKMAKKVLDRVDKIYIRETNSLKWLEKIDCKNSNIELVPDSAFSMQLESSEKVDNILYPFTENNKNIVGMTVRDWNFPEVEDTEFHRNKYIESIRKSILHINKTYGAKVLLMPQVLGPNPFNDDRNISREILKEIDKQYAELLDYDFHPRELKYMYSKMDMFIGTRMHSNIFALSTFVPTVAINYEHKTSGIMKMLELDDFVVDIKDIEPASFIEMIDRCWDNRSKLRNDLEQNIPAVVEKAELPAKVLEKLVNR